MLGSKKDLLIRYSMHHQVHHTDVVPELAGRRGMSLVARSKGEKNIPTICESPVACNRDAKSPSCGRRVVEAVPEHRSRSERRSSRAMVREWSRQSPSTSQGAERRSPRAVVRERSRQSPSTGRGASDEVPELASRRGISLVARSKGEKINASQLYVSTNDM